MPAPVRRPVLNTQQEFVPKVYPFQKVQGGMGVPIPQFSGGVTTANSPIQGVLEEPVKNNNDTSNLVPMVINEGTSMAYTVMYDPESNKVVSDGSDISNMMLRNIDAEQIALKYANDQYRKNTVVDPYLEAEQKMKVANDKFNLAQQYELGANPYLEEYTEAKQEADNILANDVKPDAIDGVLNATNTYKQAPHALEALEAKNPYEQLENKTFSEVEAIFNAPTEDKPILKNNQYDPVDDMVAGENLFAYNNDPDPVLTDKGNPKANDKGVLDTTSSNDRKGSAVSANARGSMMPYAKINRNEALMRIGGAIIGGSDQGFAGSARAATQEFGNIQDANRASETAAFNKAEATRLAEERIAALRAKGSSKDKDKTTQTLNDVSTQLNSFQSGLDAIAQSKAEGGNLTGVGGIFKSFVDNYTGSPDAARRLLLSRLKVDDALLRVAETKGAISNKEMDLFLQPAPKNFQDEQIWVDWINERMVALRNVQNRLNGNVVINESEQSYRYRAPTSRNTTTDNNAILDEADAIIGL
jgi:hypothetical protein